MRGKIQTWETQQMITNFSKSKRVKSTCTNLINNEKRWCNKQLNYVYNRPSMWDLHRIKLYQDTENILLCLYKVTHLVSNKQHFHRFLFFDSTSCRWQKEQRLENNHRSSHISLSRARTGKNHHRPVENAALPQVLNLMKLVFFSP